MQPLFTPDPNWGFRQTGDSGPGLYTPVTTVVISLVNRNVHETRQRIIFPLLTVHNITVKNIMKYRWGKRRRRGRNHRHRDREGKFESMNPMERSVLYFEDLSIYPAQYQLGQNVKMASALGKLLQCVNWSFDSGDDGDGRGSIGRDWRATEPESQGELLEREQFKLLLHRGLQPQRFPQPPSLVQSPFLLPKSSSPQLMVRI